jgi:hypothetical protein
MYFSFVKRSFPALLTLRRKRMTPIYESLSPQTKRVKGELDPCNGSIHIMAKINNPSGK